MNIVTTLILLSIGVWHFETIPGATSNISLDVDTLGMASVAYWKDSTIYYAKRIGTGDSIFWATELIDSGAVTLYPGAHAMDEKLIPHIIYFKAHSLFLFDLYYTTLDSLGGWHATKLDTLAFNVSGLDTDMSDLPHIVYSSEASGMWHQCWNGSNWIKEYINSEIAYISLVIDNVDRLHIGYAPPIVFDEDRYYIGYGVRDTSGWFTEHQIFDVRAPVGIAVGNDYDCHISFTECMSGLSWHIIRHIDGSWTHENISQYGTFHTPIDIDNTTVHLLGQDSTFTEVRHLWKESTSWQYEDVRSGVPQDLVVDKNGYLHCIIVDGLEIIYGTTVPQAVAEKTIVLANSANSATISRLPLKIPLLGYGQLRIYDIHGRLIKRLSVRHNTHELLWSGVDQQGKIINSGIYFIVFDEEENLRVRKVLIIN